MSTNYISFVSWEERFKKSLDNDIKEFNNLDNIYLFYFEDEKFYSKTKKTLDLIKNNYTNVEIEIISLKFNDYLSSWKKIESLLIKNSNEKTILNISTMPRNIIFTMFHFLKERYNNFNIIYYPPEKHGKEITKNPSKPQIILKHGGIMYPEKKTILVSLLGHDIKRVYQLYNYFEPFKIYIGQSSNHETNLPIGLNTKFDDIISKELFEIDSFHPEKLYQKLNQLITPLIKEYNIILCSLGPKLESLAIFKYHLKYPETALVYAPSKDYSDDYSHGIKIENIFEENSSFFKTL